MKKEWYQSKLIWYAILTGIAGVVSAFATHYPDIGVLATANALLVAILRFVTSQPINQD